MIHSSQKTETPERLPAQAFLLVSWSGHLHGFAAADDAQQHDDHGDHQQHMDETAHGGGGDEPQQPQDKQHNSDGVEHGNSSGEQAGRPGVGGPGNSPASQAAAGHPVSGGNRGRCG